MTGRLDEGLVLAGALAADGRANTARRVGLELLGAAPRGWTGYLPLAERLATLGALAPAMDAAARAAKLAPRDPAPLRAASAILSAAGRSAEAAALLGAAARLRPYTPRGRALGKARVLRLRTAHNAVCGLQADGERAAIRRTFRRGHFSTKHLLPKGAFAVTDALAFEDNLDAAPRPAFDVVVNTVACADLNAGPLARLARWTDGLDEGVINDPARVAATTRQANADRLGTLDGVCWPRVATLTASDAEGAIAALDEAGIALPVILRVAGTQTGRSVRLVRSADELAAAMRAFPAGTRLVATAFVDTAGADGLYWKARCFFVDGRLYPVARVTSDAWQVHSGDRYRVMDRHEAAQVAERTYLTDPEAALGRTAFAGLRRVADAIGLDFFGIDFTVLPDGRALIFEANAAMRHNFDHAGAFPYTRPHLQAVSDAFAAMVRQRAGVA